MSKLSIRPRNLDACKFIPIYKCEEIPDLNDYASINRSIPQLPTGMEKEEESVSERESLISCHERKQFDELILFVLFPKFSSSHKTRNIICSRQYRPNSPKAPPVS